MCERVGTFILSASAGAGGVDLFLKGGFCSKSEPSNELVLSNSQARRILVKHYCSRSLLFVPRTSHVRTDQELSAPRVPGSGGVLGLGFEVTSPTSNAHTVRGTSSHDPISTNTNLDDLQTRQGTPETQASETKVASYFGMVHPHGVCSPIP